MTEKSEIAEELEDDFIDFASEYPDEALSMITGWFVGLLEYRVESAGGNKNLEIKVNGGERRSITLHSVGVQE